MLTRVLLCGACLVGLQAGDAVAQTLVSATDNPVAGSPMAIDETSKAPGNIPEIIKDQDGQDSLPGSQAIADPGSVLRPPTVDL